ncbi:MAG: hypothetical protein RID53_16965 [Coleofasciculus sp. B1-GNL1-01]|uniref:hypothetical protein n=1 Tax=Coleofasciculus sp. B1-GNL1-01 TaxID=3068484 RepID=UPI003303870B
MYKDKPSNTARKVALNIVTLGAKPGMEKILPAGIVNATADLLVASGAVSATAVQWSRSRRMVWVYEAFDLLNVDQYIYRCVDIHVVATYSVQDEVWSLVSYVGKVQDLMQSEELF